MKLPKFRSEDEEHEFWARHDVEDLDQEELTEVRLDAVRPRRLALPVRIDQRTAALLKRLARRRGIPPSALVALWIHEKLGRDGDGPPSRNG
ncbi:MAG: hypothetical protein HY905_20375 [Deltaproteobacteria bacterium]|nr:hypothetical protein [Deltaproteobacteria bacterium]